MLKTFVVSPFLGALAAILGWAGAVIAVDTMDPQTFADLQFGWDGLMVGMVALAAILMALIASDIVEPLVLVASAAAGAALLWSRRELPFSTDGFSGANSNAYWFTFTMMAVIFVLLLMGLRAARESSTR